MQDQNTFGGRVTRFFALLGFVFVVTVTIVVTQRLSDDALALIVGIAIAGIPLTAVIVMGGYFLIKTRTQSQPQQIAQTQPIVLAIPQMQAPQPQSPMQFWEQQTPAIGQSKRTFQIGETYD